METKVSSQEVAYGLKSTRWITKEQLAKIEEFVQTSGGNAITRAPLMGDKPYGPTVYQLGGEPLMVMNKTSKANPELIGWVFPSEKQTKMINDAGIIDYLDILGSKNA